MPETREAVVMGGGPAGLGAALALARAGARVELIEAAPRVGGLCVTLRRDGLAYDLGGHIPFVRSEARRAWLAELLGDDLGWVDRPVSCVREGRIRRGRYLDQRPEAPEPLAARDGSARGELGHRFGPRFAARVMRPYLEKIDGIPWERIPAERARRLLEDQAAPEGFFFPARGIGQLMDAMAEAARAAGAAVSLSTRLAAVEAPGGRLQAVVVEGPAGRRRIATEQGVVALAAGLAARLLDPPPDDGALAPVRMRGVALVYLRIARERLTPEPWIQVDDPRVPFSRAFEPANWSPALTVPGATALGLECYCRPEPDDPVWGLDDAALATACARALSDPLGWLADPGQASAVEVVRLPRAYPSPDLEQLSAVRAPALWLDRIEGLHLAPGAAVIEAIEAGERAAAAILAGAPDEPVDPEGLPPIS